MIVKIKGIEKVDYISKKTGKQVVGTNLHVEFPRDDSDKAKNLTGVRVERMYCGRNVDCSGLLVDTDVNIYFDRYGNPEGFELM